ncbi:MAG: tRNA (cytosine(32)/uridine(32)-2'-O)-methyltransferase TrmJ [Methylothermaceae bacteria B42]|nr:MAG: tRNA (cytosine(32)/uridine(32)-2'-O)-methyltransferase TrmJ [Methylothermaceae bacteria B42]HHJ39978.1 RNA methyltransferase [Methylothermaceae bacterium]
MLPKIRIVLVETSHPGNIGAVARAMKNMQFYELVLVSPKQFPSSDATARAAGADDVLARAEVCDTLQEAIAGCHLVIGSTARQRTISWPQVTPRECARLLEQEPPGHRVALVFGRERSGLTNEELDLCHYWLHIPCNPGYSSLNLAAAVQIMVYELHLTRAVVAEKTPEPNLLATASQLESFYGHLQQTLQDIGFLHPRKAPSIMRRLRRLFGRVRLEKKEVDILRGILTAAQHSKGTNKSC